MVNTTVNNKAPTNQSENKGRSLILLSGIFLFIVSLTIFQDFLESKKNDHEFYFNESILFKTIWVLFIPILTVLNKKLENETLDSYPKMAAFIVTPIIVHLFILPFAAVVLSLLFYEGRYNLFKFFSYTLAHDLYKLIIVYTSFVVGYKYFVNHNRKLDNSDSKNALETIVINNGKENVVVNIKDITQITSDSPYITIHLEDKKYLHSETLKSISNQLSKDIFVRVHKSTVVNISKVSSFKSRLNGDYDLKLENDDLIRVSRTYAPDFKKRFRTSHRFKL